MSRPNRKHWRIFHNAGDDGFKAKVVTKNPWCVGWDYTKGKWVAIDADTPPPSSVGYARQYRNKRAVERAIRMLTERFPGIKLEVIHRKGKRKQGARRQKYGKWVTRGWDIGG